MKDFDMKKIITSIILGSIIAATPVAAEARHRDRGSNHHERRGGGCGWLCGAIIGGLVVGAISSDRRDRNEDRQDRYNPDYNPDRDYDNRYYPPEYRYDRRYCVREQITEWYRGERYVYWETRCN